MFQIDGSVKSGSGTILRYSLSLAALLKKDIRLFNVRAKRKKPGLRPQHLKGVEACCGLTGGRAEGAVLDSKELRFFPGRDIKGGRFDWDIGTAGSTTMMALCLLPLGLYSDEESVYRISGGLFQDFAPNAFHTKYVLMSLLRRFSAESDLDVLKPGYVPTGGGLIEIKIKPLSGALKPIRITEQGKITAIKGIAVSSHLKQRKVSERMREACGKALAGHGYRADIEVVNDNTASQSGAALFIYAVTDKGCLIGSDMAGKPGRSSEKIGRFVANSLLEDIKSGATVDRFTADQLILYAGLADGETEYIIPRLTEHVDSNIWLIKQILGAEVSLDGRRLKIRGVGFKRQKTS